MQSKQNHTIVSIYGDSFPVFLNILENILENLLDNSDFYIDVYKPAFIERLKESLEIRCKILESEKKYEEMIKTAEYQFNWINSIIDLRIEQEYNHYGLNSTLKQ